jgi:hypothetical protein
MECVLLILCLHIGLCCQESEDAHRLDDVKDGIGANIVIEFEAKDFTHMGVHN